MQTASYQMQHILYWTEWSCGHTLQHPACHGDTAAFLPSLEYCCVIHSLPMPLPSALVTRNTDSKSQLPPFEVPCGLHKEDNT